MLPFMYIKTIKCSVNERDCQLIKVEEIIKSKSFHLVTPNEIIDIGKDSLIDIFKNPPGK